MEYLNNARAYIIRAEACKDQPILWDYNTSWAEAYWINHLKVTRARQYNIKVAAFRALINTRNTTGALEYLSK